MISARPRPTIRLLFDELLPWRVATALDVLGFHTSHVGDETHGAPPRGSSDEVVLAHARRTNQVVVTSNHDMIMLCAELHESVVWLDPRGRQFQSDETALVAFRGIAEWQRRLDGAEQPVCVRVLRTKVETLALQRAADLAAQRLRALRARRARRPAGRRPALSGQELLDGDDVR